MYVVVYRRTGGRESPGSHGWLFFWYVYKSTPQLGLLYTSAPRCGEERRRKKLKRRGPLLLLLLLIFVWMVFLLPGQKPRGVYKRRCHCHPIHTVVFTREIFFSLLFLILCWSFHSRARRRERRTERSPNRPRSLDCCCVCVYGHSPFCPLLELVQLLSDYILLFCQCCSAQLAECLRPFAGIKRRLISLLDDGFLSFFEPPVFILSTPPSFLLYICFQLKILTALYMTGWSLWSVFTLWLASQFDALQWIWMDFRPGQNLKINDPGFFQVINKFTLHSMMGVINPLEKACASKIWIDY
jgi:hypothetical protein